MTKKELEEYAAKHLDGVKMDSSKSVKQYRADLVNHLSHGYEFGAVDASQTDYTLMVEMLKSSFLKSQQHGNDEGMSGYTLAGQRAEEPILRQFFDRLYHKDKREDPNVAVSIYRPGLVERKGFNGIGTSADAVIISRKTVDEDQEKVVMMPVEVKARVSRTTYRRAKNRFASLREETGCP